MLPYIYVVVGSVCFQLVAEDENDVEKGADDQNKSDVISEVFILLLLLLSHAHYLDPFICVHLNYKGKSYQLLIVHFLFSYYYYRPVMMSR